MITDLSPHSVDRKLLSELTMITAMSMYLYTSTVTTTSVTTLVQCYFTRIMW